MEPLEINVVGNCQLIIQRGNLLCVELFSQERISTLEEENGQLQERVQKSQGSDASKYAMIAVGILGVVVLLVAIRKFTTTPKTKS